MSDFIYQIREKFGNDYIESNDELRYNCPFCEHRRGKRDNDHKLYVSRSLGVFHCFKCNAKGHLVYKKEVNPNSKVYSFLQEYFDKVNDEEDEDNTFYIPSVEISKDSEAYKYCLNRGIDDEKINYYGIRLGIDHLFGRIVIPNKLFGDRGIWTDMYSSRSYIGQIPKYKNPSGANKTDIVFNLHRIAEGADDIYGVEGAITAICAGKEAVAFYGCHPSDKQISEVASKNPKNFYAVLDNDEAGRAPNLELADRMSKLINGNVFVVYMPEGQDAADLGEQRFKEYVENNKIAYHSDAYKSIINYFGGKI